MSKTPQKATGKDAPLSFSVALVLLIMGACAMGISPVFVRLSEVGPFASAFWRVFVALPILVVWFVAERKRKGRDLSISVNRAVILSGLAFSGDLIFWHLAIMNTTIANATLLACLAPVWVVLLSGWFIGETVGRNSVTGLVICLTGAVFLVGENYNVAPERLIGDFYGFITSIFFGLYFMAMRVGRRSVGGGELTLVSTLVTAACLLAVAIVSGNAFFPRTAQGYAAILALGAVSHSGGQGLLAVALGSLSAVFSSLVIFVEALAGALFGWVFFDEELGALQITGGILILFGVYIARPKE